MENIQTTLYDRYKHHSQSEINFILSHNGNVACFDGKNAYLTDERFYPLYEYRSTSYIHACTVSDNSLYMLIINANNREGDENDGTTIVVDIQTRAIIERAHIPTGWRGLSHIYIDEKEKAVWIYYGEVKVKYDFHFSPALKQGQLLYEIIYDIEKQEDTPNAYKCESLCYDVLELFKDKPIPPKHENNLFEMMNYATNKLYPHRLSQLYMAVGDYYAKATENETARETALRLYKMGLKVYPNLPVKKKIKALEK